MAKAGLWADTDAEERKRGEWGSSPGLCAAANALSAPPGEYGRKAKTQRN